MIVRGGMLDVGVLAHEFMKFDDQRRVEALEDGVQRRKCGNGCAQGGETARSRCARPRATETRSMSPTAGLARRSSSKWAPSRESVTA